MANSKKSISSRIDSDIYDKLVKVSKIEGHRFNDRKVAYIVNKIRDSINPHYRDYTDKDLKFS